MDSEAVIGIATLELNKKLFELSGWGMFRTEDDLNLETEFAWQYGKIIHRYSENISLNCEDTCPAYDLGYMLKKLPKNIQIDESVGWLTLAEFEDGWQCGYLMNGGYMEKQYVAIAKTPEDATCKLLIKVLKSGIII